MNQRKCSRCGISKPITEFYWNNKHKRYQIECLKCHAKLNVITRRKRDHRIKEDLVFYKGSVCQHCGIEYPTVCYDLHHLDPSKKSFEVSGHKHSWAKVKAEADKCILLCANCHRIEHARLRVVDEEARSN